MTGSNMSAAGEEFLTNEGLKQLGTGENSLGLRRPAGLSICMPKYRSQTRA